LPEKSPSDIRTALNKITKDLERKEIERLAAEKEAKELRKKLELWKGLNSFV